MSLQGARKATAIWCVRHACHICMNSCCHRCPVHDHLYKNVQNAWSLNQMCTVLQFTVFPHQTQHPAPFPLGQQLTSAVQGLVLFTCPKKCNTIFHGSQAHCKQKHDNISGDNCALAQDTSLLSRPLWRPLIPLDDIGGFGG